MLSLWNPNNAKLHKWYRKPLDGCKSSIGNPYSITLKKGNVNKLIVNFFCGGLSWNEETAARPITVSSFITKREAFYIDNIPNILLSSIHVGILNSKDTRNPFRDWYILNIPYSTGDFHIGNNDFTYHSKNGDEKVLYHHGDKNVKAALNVLPEFFPDTPEAMLIMGMSAGAFGCVAHSPAIRNIYPDCKNIVVYSEGSHIHTSLWHGIAKDILKVNKNLLSYINSDDLIYDLFRYAKDNMPSHTTFLHSNSIFDKELLSYMNKLNHGKLEVNTIALKEYFDTLINVVKRLKEEIPDYFYYLTDFGMKKDGTTPHIFVGTPKLFYDKMQDNTSISEWLIQTIGNNRKDVGTRFTVMLVDVEHFY